LTNSASPILDAVIRIDRLPVAGRELEVTPDAAALAAMAEQLGISAVERFHAVLTAVRFRGGIRVQGGLTARIVQPSVVTFEPVSQDIDEAVDRVFLPEPDKGYKTAPGAEVFVDLEEEDFPDYIDGPEVDLSDLLIETLALAIEPYPRLPGESLESLGIDLKDKEEGPFASLKSLRKPTDKSDE
jgi:uncharacterized metal-binding protein YceD (DUF177 family)